MRQQNLTFSDINSDFKTYWKNENRRYHGGLHSIGRRKTRRPFSAKKPIHIVMRSEIASGAMSLRLPRNKKKVSELTVRFSKRFQIRIYESSINSNHLHLVVRAKTRVSFQSFLKSLAGLIARFMLKAERNQAKGTFWSMLAFTRVSEWGKAFRKLSNYVVQNVLEAAGVIEYKPRKQSSVYQV